MKTFYFWLLSQKYELTTFLFAVLSIIFIHVFKWPYIWLITISFLSTATIIYLHVREKPFHYTSLKQRKHKDDWIGNGIFEYSQMYQCFIISNSDSGYMYAKCLAWNNYNLSFKFKIIKHSLGVIVRAVNLSNYVMLQIDLRTRGIRPHIRINGGWRPWEAQESNLEFGESISLDDWYRCNISCENRNINIELTSADGKRRIFNRGWTIPNGNIVFSFQQNEETVPISENHMEPNKKVTLVPFPIVLDYGSMGFRNDGDEQALVKEVLVSKLSS
ncbi:MAG: hypothetical protein Q7J31_13520 [Syntrophales bacterium]|nr:hypothetical protein [Syntrophales bacterium]